ncbi:MAG: hypothetical protein V3T88_01860 [Nitrosomonadaceae bacterium]
MSNTFKVGDKITVNADLDFGGRMASRDTTHGTQYTVNLIGNPVTGHKGDVTFTDDVGDVCCLTPESVTLVKD